MACLLQRIPHNFSSNTHKNNTSERTATGNFRLQIPLSLLSNQYVFPGSINVLICTNRAARANKNAGVVLGLAYIHNLFLIDLADENAQSQGEH